MPYHGGLLGEPQARDSKEKILKAVAPAVEKGEAFVQASDCRTCHTIGEGGVVGYPDLLQAPLKIKPGTFMSTFGSSTPELDAIVAYLHHLR